MVKISSLEDANLEQDLAELKKKMEHMHADFIDTDQLAGLANLVAPEECKLRRSQLGQCCCQEHCKWKAHLNLHHKFEKATDPFFQPVQLGE